MKKYLFFRTDRIGDFLVSLILIKAIKRNDPSAYVKIISSEKNYSFINKIPYINETILYPKNFNEKISLFFKLNKEQYDFIGVLDGKKRSIYFTILLKSNYKILLTTKNFFEKYFSFFFSDIINFNKVSSKIEEIQYILKKINFNFIEKDLNLFDHEDNEIENSLDLKNFTLIHFDEKWIKGDYINDYTTIQPNLKDFELFVKEILFKMKSDIVITTGSTHNKLIENFIYNFERLNKNLFIRKENNFKIYLYNRLSIFDLKNLIKKSKTIITCHGAVSHLAAAYNKKIIDIFEFSHKNFYLKWSKHFRNYNYIFRKEFINLKENILKIL